MLATYKLPASSRWNGIPAANLAQQILEWELETSKTLAALWIPEFNKANSSETSN